MNSSGRLGPGPLALYGRFVSQSVRASLQYRLSFVLMAFGYFITSGVEALGVWALFDRDGQFLHDRLCGSRIILASDGEDGEKAAPES